MFRGAVSLSLFCLLFSSLEGIGSGCVSSLPQSEKKLLKLVQRSSRSSPISLDYKNEVRLFPNISFNCSGSVVGWSLVAPLHSPPPGRLPILNLWSQPNPGSFRQKNNVTMEPCLKEVISQDRQLYLYENTIEMPLEFEPDDIMGMVLRNQARAIFKPYVMQRASFTAYHRSGPSAFKREGLYGFETDHLVPLVFLHICSKADSDYDKCMTNYRTSFPVTGPASSFDCCLPFPENVRAVEEECGQVNVSWERGDMSVNTIISWRGRDGATGYERAGPGDSHLLTLDYSETGPVEIAVTFSFSSSVCNKTTITQYNDSKCGSSTDDADKTTYIAVGVGVTVGILLGLIAGVVATVIVMLTVTRKKNEKAVRGSSERDTELSAVNATVQEPQSPPVVYETVSGVVVGTTDPDTSDNVAYAVSETLSTTNNPAYGSLPTKK